MDTAAEKQRIRETMRERLLHSPTQNLAVESRLICKKLKELLPKPPRVLAAFFPLLNEPDLRPFLQEAIQQEIELYLPAVEERSLVFRHVHSLQELSTGPWNIPEPHRRCQPLDVQKLQYALIPGRAFDQKGWRLGRGGAGYDRWIREQRSLNPSTIFWGIAFECQILPQVPHMEHDERLDGIITTSGLHRTDSSTHNEEKNPL